MKLFHSQTSPFVRKVMATAHHLGLVERITLLPGAASPVNRDTAIAEANPMGRVPTAVLDDGTVLSESRTICEWMAAQGGDPAYLPAPGPARWDVLELHALGDGMLEAALLARYEVAMRPEALRWDDWLAGQMGKVEATVDRLEDQAARLSGPVTFGTITVGCALGYLDFRFAEFGWRGRAPRLDAWWTEFGESVPMRATRPA